MTAIVGGRPGMISGATGAMAVVVVGLVAVHGIEYLFPAVIRCGVIQIMVGLLRWGKLIRRVPHPVMLGFVNGLAIVILMAQFGSFKTLGPDGGLRYLTGMPLAIMLALVALTMGIIVVLPRLTKVVPASLAAIIIVTLLAFGLNHGGLLEPHGNRRPVLTVKDMLVTHSKAAAVHEAARSSQARQAATGEPVAIAGVAAGSHVEAGAAALSPAEIESTLASVDSTTIGIAGGLPGFSSSNTSCRR